MEHGISVYGFIGLLFFCCFVLIALIPLFCIGYVFDLLYEYCVKIKSYFDGKRK